MTQAVRILLRAEGRARWRAWLGIALIFGIGWGAVLTAAAGARRTDSAYVRFQKRTGAHDVLVAANGPSVPKFTDDIAKLPEVARAGAEIGLGVEIVKPKLPPTIRFDNVANVPADLAEGRTVDRPKLLRGRLPDPRKRDEALLNTPFAKALGVDVGDTITLRPQAEDNDPSTPVVNGPEFNVRVVGIGVSQSEAFPISSWDKSQTFMLLSHALYGVYPDFTAFDGGVYKLRPGTKISEFQAHVVALQKRHPETGPDQPPYFADETGRAKIVHSAMQPEGSAIALFAAALGLTLVLLLAQSVGRTIRTNAGDFPTLRALGATPRELTFAAMVPALLAAVVAAVIAACVAIVASPLTPVGAARLAEPDPGIAVDLPVLLIGGAVLIVIVAAVAFVPAVRAARTSLVGEDETLAGGSRVANAAARSSLSAPASTGIRMALQPGRGVSSVPVRSVKGVGFIALLGLAAAVTFGASCNFAVDTPRLYGQRWDTIVDAQFTPLFPEHLHLLSDPSIASVTMGIYPPGPFSIAGHAVPAIAVQQVKGSQFPTLLQGRAPRTADEIVLGTTTLKTVHRRVGQEVVVDQGGPKRTMHIVGRAVFPAFGLGVFTPTGLGEGAIVTTAALGPTDLPSGSYSFALVGYARNASPATVARVQNACALPELAVNLCQTVRAQQPPEIESYGRVRNLPWVLTGVLAALGAMTLAHGLFATVRRRRRDLAILKTLGFVRQQVSAAVAWQATALVVVALIGIPLGIVAGRWGWTTLAGQLGMPAEPRVPLTAILVTIPATVLIANLVAALPARAAGRTRAALVLRAE